MLFYHQTADGRVIPLDEMEDSHLINTIKSIKKRAQYGAVIRHGGGGPETEDMWYEEEILSYEDSLDFFNYGIYVAEAKRRRLPLPV